jgi:UDP-N-acetylmuramoyl-tripeptide--D-alanyl-D-alanine ligase
MGWQYTLSELAQMVGAQAPESNASFSAVSKDTRSLEPGDIYFALQGEQFDGERFVSDAFAAGASAAVCSSPNADGPCLVVPDALAALQQFAAHHRSRFDIPIVAITGSCGKTTAKDFTSAVLATRYTVAKTEGNLNNEIGCPLSILNIDTETDIAVIEMGANHAGEIRSLCAWARPTESAITIIAPAHLEGFGSIENVAQAKSEIAESLGAEGVFYINNDDARCRAIGEQVDCEKMTFGDTGQVAIREYRRREDGEVELDIDPIGTICIPLACRAHATNVLLAIAVGLRHGVEQFEAPLRDALQHATRFTIREMGPLRIIDDTYNANPASMKAALESLYELPGDGARYAVLGDMRELGEDAAAYHTEIGEYAARLGTTGLFALGQHAGDMVEGARDVGINLAEAYSDIKLIAHAIAEAAAPGDTVLIKGSRGLRMENVIAELERIYNVERGEG